MTICLSLFSKHDVCTIYYLQPFSFNCNTVYIHSFGDNLDMLIFVLGFLVVCNRARVYVGFVL